MKNIVVDILKMEIEQNLPYWLSEEEKNKPQLEAQLDALRKKYRDEWLAKQAQEKVSGT